MDAGNREAFESKRVQELLLYISRIQPALSSGISELAKVLVGRTEKPRSKGVGRDIQSLVVAN